MVFEGALNHGEYIDDFADVHPNILERYYGTPSGANQDKPDPEIRNSHHTEIEEQIAADQGGNVRHDAIPPAEHQNPFRDSEAMQLLFRQMVAELGTSIPLGYGVHETEWGEDESYPTIERIPMRGSRFLDVALPFEIWWPRAVHWAKALKLLLMMLETQA